MGWRGVTWHTFPPSVTKKTVHLGFFRQVSQSSRDPQSSPEQIASGQGGNLVFLFKFENPTPPKKKKQKTNPKKHLNQLTVINTFWAERCGYNMLVDRALWLGQARGPSSAARKG